MTALTGVPAGPALPRSPEPVVPSTFLAPDDPFPSALAELDLLELQVLHSRVSRQLEQEHLAHPDGPHPVTRDRCQELAAELDTRQRFLAPPDRVSTASPERRDVREAGPLAPPEEPQPARPAAVAEIGAVIKDLGEVRAGDRIEVWHGGQRHCLGTVEESCPALGVVWLHEAGDGYRRMIHAQDTELRRHVPRDGR